MSVQGLYNHSCLRSDLHRCRCYDDGHCWGACSKSESERGGDIQAAAGVSDLHLYVLRTLARHLPGCSALRERDSARPADLGATEDDPDNVRRGERQVPILIQSLHKHGKWRIHRSGTRAICLQRHLEGRPGKEVQVERAADIQPRARGVHQGEEDRSSHRLVLCQGATPVREAHGRAHAHDARGRAPGHDDVDGGAAALGDSIPVLIDHSDTDGDRGPHGRRGRVARVKCIASGDTSGKMDDHGTRYVSGWVACILESH
mmetsp:Transcript_86111/g.244294  ORF Transcript_86111/g.244294 Transcript_86111/m.244294 type:complete len:260 (-) Transcript_86111:545-1324(-)